MPISSILSNRQKHRSKAGNSADKELEIGLAANTPLVPIPNMPCWRQESRSGTAIICFSENREKKIAFWIRPDRRKSTVREVERHHKESEKGGSPEYLPQ
ncbi:MAG: hypothetical protein ACLR8P_06915 [Clostridium fessum]